MLAAAAAFFLLRGEEEKPADLPAPVEEKITIAVLPFDDLSETQDQEFFGKGIAESILNKLTNVERLRVFSRTSSFEFKTLGKPVVEQCREHSIDWLLERSFRKSGDRLLITAQLIRVEDQAHIFSEEYPRDSKDIFDVQSEIALEILKELKFTLMGKELAAVAKQYTNDPDAYELYLKALEEDDTLKLALYEQAIEKDQDFALVYAKIADRYNSLGYGGKKEFFPKAKEMAQKALDIDSTLAEAHAEMAWYSYV